ncbi:hypothetical protein [Arenimonas sp.]|uniref:hypothetical protein n=1 Tax=Arenimonas sp. TaxID=1872635 RepID=UPI0039E4C479
MRYEDYYDTAQKVSALVDGNAFEEAIRLFGLIDSDLADLDKSVMCVNMAVVLQKTQRNEEALQWYDRGIGYEALYLRFRRRIEGGIPASTGYANQESLEIYSQLLDQPYLNAQENERMRNNVDALHRLIKDAAAPAAR